MESDFRDKVREFYENKGSFSDPLQVGSTPIGWRTLGPDGFRNNNFQLGDLTEIAAIAERFDKLSYSERVRFYYKLLTEFPPYFLLSMSDQRSGWNWSSSDLSNAIPINAYFTSQTTSSPFDAFFRNGQDPIEAFQAIESTIPAGSCTSSPLSALYERDIFSLHIRLLNIITGRDYEVREAIYRELQNPIDPKFEKEIEAEVILQFFNQALHEVVKKSLELMIQEKVSKDIDTSDLLALITNSGTEQPLFINAALLGAFPQAEAFFVQESKKSAGSGSPSTAEMMPGNTDWIGRTLWEGKLEGFEHFQFVELELNDSNQPDGIKTMEQMAQDTQDFADRVLNFGDKTAVGLFKIIFGAKGGHIIGNLKEALCLKEEKPDRFKIAIDYAQARGDFRDYLVDVLIDMKKLSIVYNEIREKLPVDLQSKLANIANEEVRVDAIKQYYCNTINMFHYIDFFYSSTSKNIAGAPFAGDFYASRFEEQNLENGIRQMIRNGKANAFMRIAHATNFLHENHFFNRFFGESTLANVPLVYRFLSGARIVEMKNTINEKHWKYISEKLIGKIQNIGNMRKRIKVYNHKNTADKSIQLLDLNIEGVGRPTKDMGKWFHGLMAMVIPSNIFDRYDDTNFFSKLTTEQYQGRSFLSATFNIGQPWEGGKGSYLRIATDHVMKIMIYMKAMDLYLSPSFSPTNMTEAIDLAIEQFGDTFFAPLFDKLEFLTLNFSKLYHRIKLDEKLKILRFKD